MSKRAKVVGGRLKFLPPQIPTRVERPPEGEGWVHEANLDGHDLGFLPLLQRKQALWQLIEPGLGKIQYSEHFEGSALALFRTVEKIGLNGIISKRADSRYRSGLSNTWLKAK
ncbi:MAG: hypothetical protein E5Y60_06950 [Mesorhizobium sp.]|nr:MAG: hypothetical protein E5Y60_06950 [Mesorhizobium sp.]